MLCRLPEPLVFPTSTLVAHSLDPQVGEESFHFWPLLLKFFSTLLPFTVVLHFLPPAMPTLLQTSPVHTKTALINSVPT